MIIAVKEFSVYFQTDIIMAVLEMAPSSELCEDTNSKWKNMLRSKKSSGQEKPQWRAAVKVRSPSERSFAEGGSLMTNRHKMKEREGRSESRIRWDHNFL